MFYSNEGNPLEPVHIHAIKDGIDAKFWLNPVRLSYNDGFDAKTLRELLETVENHVQLIEEAWHEFFS